MAAMVFAIVNESTMTLIIDDALYGAYMIFKRKVDMELTKKSFTAFIAMALVLALMPFSVKQADAATVKYNVPVTYGQTEARSMLSMINSFRASSPKCWNETDTEEVTLSNLMPLVYDYELEKVAMQRAAEIAVSFSHTRPNGTSCITAFPDSYYSFAENIAAGSSTAQGTFVQWREDSEKYDGQGHRRNMLLHSVSAVGIGHVVFNGVHFWVQNFGSPSASTVATSAVNSARTVGVDISDSIITGKSIKLSSSKVTVSSGSKVSLPSANLSLKVNDAWPSGTVSLSASNPVWKSSNTSIASISGGSIVGKKPGTTKIKVTANGLSAQISVTVSKPAKPTLKSVSGAKKLLKIKWGKVAKATGYSIWCSTSKSFTSKTTVKKTVSKQSATSLTVKKLKKAKTYYVKARSYVKVSGKTYYSNWSTTKKAKTK